MIEIGSHFAIPLPKNVGFQLKWSIASVWYSTHSSFLPYILLYKLGDARILNFPHFVSHLEKEWDNKESGLQLRYFHGGNKKPKLMLVLFSNALSIGYMVWTSCHWMKSDVNLNITSLWQAIEYLHRFWKILGWTPFSQWNFKVQYLVIFRKNLAQFVWQRFL